MSRSGYRLGWLVLLAAAPLFVSGCADPKDKQIADLNTEVEKLRNELNDKDARMARMMNEQSTPVSGSSAADQDTIRSLNSELASLRDRLREAEAKGKAAPIAEMGDGKWIGMPGFDMLTLPGEVLFDSGKATLKPSGKTTLDRIASDIRKQFPDREIYVVGHTDNDPIRKSGWKDNWELGAQRSLTTARYLVQAGVSPNKVIQANRGEFSPRGDNGSASGKSKNRRVEFYAVVKGSQGISEPTQVGLSSPKR
ncbi:MAG: OmpA family protein [Phycisphaerae bacterium]